MIDVVANTDRYRSALARLAEQYKDRPILAALIRVFAERAQEIEVMLFSVLLGYRLSTPAEGEQLDVIGRVVGQARESADDAEYRGRISARIRANISTGAARDLYAVFGILLPDHDLTVEPRYPASFFMDATSHPIDESLLSLYVGFFHDTKAGGVYGQFHYSFTEPADTFTYATGNAPEADADAGYGDTGDPGAGGSYSGVFV